MRYRWRCCLCPQRGICQTERDAVRAFEWHYGKKHKTKEKA